MIHQLFERQVERTPDKLALVYQDEALTYAALDAQANRLARRLQRLGLGPDQIVGLHMGRSTELMVAVLGVLKAGAAYLPLDPQYPHERLASMAADAGVSAVLAQENVEAIALDVPRLEYSKNPQWSSEDPSTPTCAATARNLAYVLYTSGSTGRPKGVEIEHHSLVNFTESLADLIPFGDDEIVASVTGLTFDIAGLDMYLTWMRGGRLVLVPRAAVFDGPRLREVVERSGATLLQTTPVTWRTLLGAGWSAPPGFKALCGGEAMPAVLRDDLLAQPVRLWNLYGPTETTIWSTLGEMRRPAENPISVGHPIANTRIYVLDDDMRIAPVGEVHIGGRGVARGYRAQPALTAERFVPSPFDPGDRLYKTGDLGSFLPNGELVIIGRRDAQIKYHGYRIEPAEIEAAIQQVTGIKQCAAGLREVDGEESIVAWLVRPVHDPDGLPRKLSSVLPAYMIPARFFEVSHLPLNANGKIDRGALELPQEMSTFATFLPMAPTDNPHEVADARAPTRRGGLT